MAGRSGQVGALLLQSPFSAPRIRDGLERARIFLSPSNFRRVICGLWETLACDTPFAESERRIVLLFLDWGSRVSSSAPYIDQHAIWVPPRGIALFDLHTLSPPDPPLNVSRRPTAGSKLNKTN
jgi:hypothetical protein